MKRITIETLASGQPQAYADSRLHVRVTFESFFPWLGDPNHPKSKWEPLLNWTEEQVRTALRTLNCGFTDKPPEHWSSDRLASLTQTAPGVWEFVVISPFTD